MKTVSPFILSFSHKKIKQTGIENNLYDLELELNKTIVNTEIYLTKSYLTNAAGDPTSDEQNDR